MFEYFFSHPHKILIPLEEHAVLVLVTLAASLLFASLFTVIALKNSSARKLMEGVFAVIYSVPSLAMFALLIPVTGLGKLSAVIALTLYNQYLLLNNFIRGIDEVDETVVEAARGMGMTDMQLLFKVQLPLARKAMFAGVRLSVVSTIGIGTIAASINAGGLGTLLFEGLRTMNSAKILWGCILSAFMAISVNQILKKVEESI